MNIAVYCSSRAGLEQEYIDIARGLGRWIADNGHTLVYGGVKAGLMHELAQSCHDHGGRLVGINIVAFSKRTDPLADEVLLTRDLGERKSRMIEMAHAFVVLPGGLGTLDEWVSTITQLIADGDDTRPVVVANLHGIYDGMLRYLEQMAQTPFARDKHLQRSVIVADTRQLLECLTQYCNNNEK